MLSGVCHVFMCVYIMFLYILLPHKNQYAGEGGGIVWECVSGVLSIRLAVCSVLPLSLSFCLLFPADSIVSGRSIGLVFYLIHLLNCYCTGSSRLACLFRLVGCGTEVRAVG